RRFKLSLFFTPSLSVIEKRRPRLLKVAIPVSSKADCSGRHSLPSARINRVALSKPIRDFSLLSPSKSISRQKLHARRVPSQQRVQPDNFYCPVRRAANALS